MTDHDWEARYRDGDLPWDTGSPDPHVVEFVESHEGFPDGGSGRALEVGCGTGTDSIWLARQGFQVLGVDVSATAIERARSRAEGVSGVRFECLDILRDGLPEGSPGSFDLAVDIGCFHVFDDPADRALFAARVAESLAPGGRWLSVIGSTEGPERDHGPPRRSLRDIAAAIEPVLEITEIRSTEIHANIPSPARAWLCVARPRRVPAQPSTDRSRG